MKAIVHQEEDRTKAMLTSLILHVGLLAVLIFYTFDMPEKAEEPPPVFVNIEWGGGGDDAAQGEPDRGMNSSSAPIGPPASDDAAEEIQDVPAEPAPTPPQPTAPAKTESKPEPPKSTTPTTEDPSVAALRRQQEEAKRKQEQEQARIRAEQERVAAAERERQRIAQEAAAEKARQEKARRDRIKNSGLGGGTGGTGAGTGTGGRQGNQGIPGGTGNNPGGTSAGTGGGTGGGDGTGAGGSVGGGLGGRKVVSKVKANDKSQKQGTVRVKVCVDSSGRVVSAEPTQAGSTTTDGGLRAAATAAARQWRFESAPGADTQCGWIEFNFILR